ncbi:hypothetical protein OESDEN_05363 [Oesophagostomum dentatum]|uniref:Uncharacterized protein n=1 Tax=Oesophagostomum dentatum TaxID=61180 RepID=A0A0B1TAY5_OESDE|nr:hypothetical protein OESDEN_05363 [Oesophagostomum dentatum]
MLNSSQFETCNQQKEVSCFCYRKEMEEKTWDDILIEIFFHHLYAATGRAVLQQESRSTRTALCSTHFLLLDSWYAIRHLLLLHKETSETINLPLNASFNSFLFSICVSKVYV